MQQKHYLYSTAHNCIEKSGFPKFHNIAIKILQLLCIHSLTITVNYNAPYCL